MLAMLINLAVLTCYREACRAAGNGSQVLNGGNTLIGSFVWLVMFRVDHMAEEQRAIGQYFSPLVWNQAHEGAVFLPFDVCRRGCVAVCRTVEESGVPPDGQRVLGLHGEPEGAEGLHCWSWGATEGRSEMSTQKVTSGPLFSER